jgi:uncharacterized protein (DUF736 family)
MFAFEHRRPLIVAAHRRMLLSILFFTRSRKDTTMAIIGNFTYDPADDTYVGEIATLTLHRREVTLSPANKSHDREPDYRIMQDQESGTVEIGAGWKRTSERGREFVSIVLDDPALPAPISAAMFLSEQGSSATLVWQRAPKKAPAPEAEAGRTTTRRTKAPLRPVPA